VKRAFLVLLSLVLGGRVARADEPAVTAATFVHLGAHAHVQVASGYDSANGNLDLRAAGEASLGHGVSVRAGVETTSAPAHERPFVGLRAHLLDEAEAGVDAWLGVAYEQDGIRSGEGRYELAAAFARGGLYASLAYAQDDENDDRQADVEIAALHTFTPSWRAGAAAGLRADLFSDDEKRQPGEPDLELVAGPMATASLGALSFFGQIGVSTVRTQQVDVGVLAVAGVGAAF
jgi:hypothetical protein